MSLTLLYYCSNEVCFVAVQTIFIVQLSSFIICALKKSAGILDLMPCGYLWDEWCYVDKRLYLCFFKSYPLTSSVLQVRELLPTEQIIFTSHPPHLPPHGDGPTTGGWDQKPPSLQSGECLLLTERPQGPHRIKLQPESLPPLSS